MSFRFLFIAVVCFAIALILQENKIHELQRKFRIVAEKHNGLIDTIVETYDDLCNQFNDSIDDINYEFDGVYEVLWQAKKVNDDIVDTLEIMCDTDEAALDRINDIEEELALINVSIDDLDSILFEAFDEEEEIEETKKEKKSNKKK